MATKLRRAVQFVTEFSNFATRCETRKAMDRFPSGGCVLLKLLRSRHYASVEVNPKTSRLFSAVCVQRLPLITRQQTELEKRFQDLQERLELEHSVLSDDEVELKKLQDRKKMMRDDDDEESMAIAKAEADRKEFEEEQEEECMNFQPGGRETEADKLNDLKSLNRKLEETLILLIKSHRDAKTWEVPHREVDSSTKSLKEVASVALGETCGSDLSVQFFSGIPIAVLKTHNTKVFFYKANYLNGSVSLQEDYCDYVWLTKSEIEDYVDPEYYKTLKRFLS